MKTKGFYVLVFVYLINSPELFSQDDDLFTQYKQILPRGGIPAIVNPVYVSAEEAFINDETWVLGVMIEGQPRAYSLNLLNHHEIVNDQIDTTFFAAVW